MSATPRIFCIGMNYQKHVEELSNILPPSPVVFMKPAACAVEPGETIPHPRHGKELHHEVEMILRMGSAPDLKNPESALKAVEAVTIGLDLTLRDVQKTLKEQGHPWEMAKAFEKSAPLGNFVNVSEEMNLDNMPLSCSVNGKIRQKGNTRDMIFSAGQLILRVSEVWSLRAGDLIYTGTPEGVGPLKVGDTITVDSEPIGSFSWQIGESK